MIFTSDAILQKYSIEDYTMKGTQRFIDYMRQRGVELELVEPACGRRKSTFRILSEIQDDENEVWKECPQYPNWEFSNLGQVRNKETKKFYGKGQKKAEGYYSIAIDSNTRLPVHRGVMMSFCPIEKPENFVVDHINGMRNDNRVENLRWAWQRENAEYGDQNNMALRTLLADLIQIYGYEETKNKLIDLLPKN